MKNLFLVLIVFISYWSQAQELKFVVQVTTDQVKDANNGAVNIKEVATTMQQEFTQFLNDRIWSNDKFRENEKIKCYLAINITSVPEQYSYKCNAQIQVSRPVYGTTYESLVLNYVDQNFDFTYQPGQQLNSFSDNTYTSNITSLLAFYAYLSLGFDYDSFSKLGGTPHFEKAFNIVNNAQASSNEGWKSVENQFNKYWIMENINSAQMQGIREASYNYHRKLDQFEKEPKAARDMMFEYMSAVKKAAEYKPGAILIRTFFKTKDNEIVGLFSEAPTEEKQKIYDIVRQLDPSGMKLYEKIMK